MVHLDNAPLARSFAAQLGSLRESIAREWHPATPQAGFVEWAIARSGSTIDLGVDPLCIKTLPEHRWTEAPVLAAVGFRLHAPPTSVTEVQQWISGMRRLMARDPIPADRNSFFFSPLELLGLATGARSVETTDASPLGWLRETINMHADRLPVSRFWSQTLVSVAAQQVSARAVATDLTLQKSPLQVALSLWLHLSDARIVPAITSTDHVNHRRELLNAAAATEPELRGVAERGIFAIALHDAVLAAVGRTELHPSSAAQFVVSLCRQFPLLVLSLRSRYDKRPPFEVNDEYDLQDLLRATLRLHFADVRPEEWNPSYAGTQSRSDFLLKPERVIIETKMTRARLGQRELVQELTIDKAQYRTHPDCETLICFVYDPDHRVQNPVALERDLSDHTPGLRTLVVVSPQGL